MNGKTENYNNGKPVKSVILLSLAVVCIVASTFIAGCMWNPLGNATQPEPTQQVQVPGGITVNITTAIPTIDVNTLGYEITLVNKYYQEPNPSIMKGGYFVVDVTGTTYMFDIYEPENANKEAYDSVDAGKTYRVLAEDGTPSNPAKRITSLITKTKRWWFF